MTPCLQICALPQARFFEAISVGGNFNGCRPGSGKMLPGIFIQLPASRGTFRSRTPSIPRCNCYVTQKLARASSSSPGVVIVRSSWPREFTWNDLIQSTPGVNKKVNVPFSCSSPKVITDCNRCIPSVVLTAAGPSTVTAFLEDILAFQTICHAANCCLLRQLFGPIGICIFLTTHTHTRGG